MPRGCCGGPSAPEGRASLVGTGEAAGGGGKKRREAAGGGRGQRRSGERCEGRQPPRLRSGKAAIEGVSQPGASLREKGGKKMETALRELAGVLAGLGTGPRKVWSFPVTR